jgi:hypothetical protein
MENSLARSGIEVRSTALFANVLSLLALPALSFPRPNREEEFIVLESLPTKIFPAVQPIHKLQWILKSHAMTGSGTTLFVIADYLSVKPRIAEMNVKSAYNLVNFGYTIGRELIQV